MASVRHTRILLLMEQTARRGEVPLSSLSRDGPREPSRDSSRDRLREDLPVETLVDPADGISGEQEVSEPYEANSEVRPSAPTLHEHRSRVPSSPPIVRSNPPPAVMAAALRASAMDVVVPELSSQTQTRLPDPAHSPDDGQSISLTMRSGSPSQPRELVGTQLGRYEVLEELGHGGMATVFRAHDPRLERHVALKVIHRHLRDNAEIALRFRHEAKTVAKLKHPSIVEIYDVPDLEGERFLVAELVEGPSLRKFLYELSVDMQRAGVPETSGLIPPEFAAAMMLQVLGALSCAHAQGIIHRDVKPENILLAQAKPTLTPPTSVRAIDLRGDKSPTSLRPVEIRAAAATSQRVSDSRGIAPALKLTDFGIAKLLDGQGMTSTGQILGSPAHMAPEQIEGTEITTRVDLFAAGVLFYELITGKLPFDGKNPAQVIRRVLDGQFSPPDRIVPSVGGRFSAIVTSLLERDPARRPATADDVAAQILDELHRLGFVDAALELRRYLEDPVTVAKQHGVRMKPVLLEQALAYREAGNVVGAAHDLNRALAYDPTDPRLVEAASALRSRHRLRQTLKIVGPVLLVAAIGLAVVLPVGRVPLIVAPVARDLLATRVPDVLPKPVASASTSASASSPTVEIKPSTSVSAAPSVSVPPSAIASKPYLIGPLTLPDAGSSKARRVRFVVFPPRTAKFTVDGNSYEPGSESELSVGSHKVRAEGLNGCCDLYEKTLSVPDGDDTWSMAVTLTLKPAVIRVSGVDDATIIVRRSDGTEIARGKPPLAVYFGTETRFVDATVTVESGSSTKHVKKNLAPGDPVFIDF